MTYFCPHDEVIFSEKAFKNLKAIPRKEAGRVLEAIEELAENPGRKRM